MEDDFRLQIAFVEMLQFKEILPVFLQLTLIDQSGWADWLYGVADTLTGHQRLNEKFWKISMI